MVLNQVVLVGRIASDLKINEAEKKKVATISVAITRNFKNSEGIYETDIIPVRLWQPIVENSVEYCKVGDLIGVKGSLQTNDNSVVVVANKVTFLSSSKSKEEE